MVMGTFTGDDMRRPVMGFAVEDRRTGEKADEVAIAEKRSARGTSMVDRR
jgi:hypothetical protein